MLHAVALRFVATLLGCTCLAAVHAKDIVVAQVAPFSGAQAITGKAIHAGAKLYLDFVNARGGIGGAPVRLVTYDDAQKPEETVRLVKQAVRERAPVALLGTVGTSNLQALIKDDVLEREGVALVGAVSGATSVIGAPGMFVVKASYRDEVDQLLRQLATVGIKRIGLVYQDDGFGADVVAGAEVSAKRYALELVARASYPRNTLSVEAAVQALLEADPQAILVGATTAAGIEFVKQYRQRGGLASLYAMSIVDTAAVQAKLGPQMARGFAFMVVTPGVTQINLPIVQEYRRLKDAAPDPNLGARSMEGFIAAKAIVQALQAGATSPAALRRVLRSRAFDLGGYTLDFQTPGRSGSRYVDIGMFGRGGQVVH